MALDKIGPGVPVSVSIQISVFTLSGLRFHKIIGISVGGLEGKKRVIFFFLVPKRQLGNFRTPEYNMHLSSRKLIHVT